MDAEDRCSSSSPSPSSSLASGPSPKRKAGRRKFKETRHPVYRGVRERNGGKWVCEVREPNKKSRLWLGTYATPTWPPVPMMSLSLRCVEVQNFPDSAWALPRPRSASRVDIRIAAAEAAEMFHVTERAEGKLEKAVFVDEEEVFNMPVLMDELAAGMMVTPMAMQRGFDGMGLSVIWIFLFGVIYRDM